VRRQPVKLVHGVTVLGNLAIDVIDGAPRSPGGCASFAGVALEAVGGPSRIVALGAESDHALFDPLLERTETKRLQSSTLLLEEAPATGESGPRSHRRQVLDLRV